MFNSKLINLILKTYAELEQIPLPVQLTRPKTEAPQISILIVDNGLEYTALSELWRVHLTRATNADFAHRYELYIINWSLGDSLTLILY
jgi:hypothetical protein